MTKRGWLVGALILVVTLGSGCLASSETRSGAKDLEHDLGTPSWASSVAVETGVDGQYADFVRVTVRLKGTVSPSDVAGFVDALPDTAAKSGLDLPDLVLVSATGAELDVDWQDSVVVDELSRGVSEWLGVASALGGAVVATVRTDGGASYVVTLPDGDPSAVHDTYVTLGPLAEPDTAWQVLATSGAISLDFSDSVLPTDDQLATWDALVGSLSKLPADLPPSHLSLHLLERTVADVIVVAPDDTTYDTFTIERYGDRVWPAVRPELAALAKLPDAWTYSASFAPTYAPQAMNIFISLLSDQAPIDNGDEPTRWSQAAAEYVRGL